MELALGLLGLLVGIPGFIISLPWLKKKLSGLLNKSDVFVFGPSAVGKTSLLQVVQGKSPPIEHIATKGRKETGRIEADFGMFQNQAVLMRRVVEFGAEHETLFKTAVRLQNPTGIILLVDHARQNEAVKYAEIVVAAVKSLSEEIVIEAIKVRAILVLVNKSDVWGRDPLTIQKILRSYSTNSFSKELNKVRRFCPHVTILVRASCLIDPILRRYTYEALGEFTEILRQ